jgi:1-acyl-sn-glycerol-3-phosphate acyltransferase
MSIIVLPEGHRTLDGNFRPFMRGVFLLAKEAGTAIMPMVMVGAFEINRKGSLLVRPGKMVLRFGEPISYEDIKDLKVGDIRNKVRDRMLELFNREREQR